MRFICNFEMVEAFLSKKTNPEGIKLKVNKLHYLKIKFSAQWKYHHKYSQKTNDQQEKHLKHILLTND